MLNCFPPNSMYPNTGNFCSSSEGNLFFRREKIVLNERGDETKSPKRSVHSVVWLEQLGKNPYEDSTEFTGPVVSLKQCSEFKVISINRLPTHVPNQQQYQRASTAFSEDYRDGDYKWERGRVCNIRANKNKSIQQATLQSSVAKRHIGVYAKFLYLILIREGSRFFMNITPTLPAGYSSNFYHSTQ